MSNPFSTKNWTLGAVPFRFVEPDVSGDGIVDLFERRHCGQIIGPHGSGKSTLVESLKTVFLRRGYAIRHLMLTDRNRRLPERFLFEKLNAPVVRIVDGFEQLSLWNRFRLRWKVGNGLLIITHCPVFFIPILYRTAPRWDVFQELARSFSDQIDETELRRVFEKSEGNFRNAFLRLYDVFDEASERSEAE